MYYFLNDYSEGALPEVMQALVRTNSESTCGYGLDDYCSAAAEAVKTRFSCPNAAVHFLMGGTQTNATAISAFLRPWEAVIAASTAHIFAHETGAVEARGHQIYTERTTDGKLTPALILEAVEAHRVGADEHMVLPRLVYLSNSTELGTIYCREELAAISDVCKANNLLLYLDGARLGVALTAPGNDLRAEDLSRFCDAFYVGGTKGGLLFGEALVIVNDTLKPYFRNMIKQNGGMLAKGRLLGVQFQALLEKDLWLSAAEHANQMAALLSAGITSAGYRLLVPAVTNQVFVILPVSFAKTLQLQFAFEFSSRYDAQNAVYRFVTSWATQPAWVDALLSALRCGAK